MITGIGTRVKMAIEVLGSISQSEVARRVGMPRDAFNRSVNGQRTFTPVELDKISRTVGASLHWLVTGDPEPARTQRDRIPDAVAAAVAYPASAYRQVDILPPWKLVPAPKATAEQAAAQARATLVATAGEGFVENLPASLERAFGLDIFVLPAGPAYDARSVHIGKSAYIAARATGAWYVANHALARELGHLVRGTFPPIDAREGSHRGWADDFADHLLVPAQGLASVLAGEQAAAGTAAGELLWTFGVPAAVLGRRIESVAPRSPLLAALRRGSTLSLMGRAAGSEDLLRRAGVYRGPRLPRALLAALVDAIQDGSADGRVLAWMLDVPLSDVVSSAA